MLPTGIGSAGEWDHALDAPLRRAARRLPANGALSAGPVTPAGKVRVSANGVAHGLRAERVVLPHEDPIRYVEHVQVWVDALKPGDDAELEVVVNVADLRWRLQRLDQIELNRTRAEALAQAEELPEAQFLALVERAAQAAAVMAEVLPSPRVAADADIQALLAPVRSVIEMIRAVEAEQPKLFLGSRQLAIAVEAATGLGVQDLGGEVYSALVAVARACAEAVAEQLPLARDAAEKARKALAAVVPLPDGKQAALLVRYRRDIERSLQAAMAFLGAVKERKMQVAGTSGLVGQPLQIRLVG